MWRRKTPRTSSSAAAKEVCVTTSSSTGPIASSRPSQVRAGFLCSPLSRSTCVEPECDSLKQHLVPLLFSAAATNKPMMAKPPVVTTLMYSLVPIMAITAVVLLSFWMYRHHKLAYPPVLVPTQVRRALGVSMFVSRMFSCVAVSSWIISCLSSASQHAFHIMIEVNPVVTASLCSSVCIRPLPQPDVCFHTRLSVALFPLLFVHRWTRVAVHV